jgi:predicted HTH domain antitoxin
LTISVRYEHPNDLKFLKDMMGLKMSEMLRELINEGRKMKSIELYKQGKVSVGLGAKIAGLSISEYMDLLKEYKVMINIDIDDAKSSLDYARKIL